MTDPHSTRAQVITGLRQLADYLDSHSDVPVSEFGWDLLICAREETDAAGMAEVDRIAAVLGVQVSDCTADGGHYMAIKTFGRITYEAVYIPTRRRAAHRALMSYADCFGTDDTHGDDSPQAA